MKKRITAISTLIVLGIGIPTISPFVYAEENENFDQPRSRIQMEILDTNMELLQVKNELERLNEQIARIEQAILDNTEMINQTEEKIKVSQKEIAGLEKEISFLEGKVFKRNEVLKKRALTFQESGGKVSYLDVLLGSVSFADFIDRIGAVAAIVEADQNLIHIHEEDILTIEKKHSEVKTKLIEQKEMMTELEGMRTQILEQKQHNDQLKEELKNKEQETLAQQENLQLQEHKLVEGLGFDISDLLNGTQLFPNETVQKIVTAGFQYIGRSVYVFGGGRTEEDIANGRFDCSAFVRWAFSQGNIQIGASTEALKNEGTPVKVEEMLPGDLVFFDTYKKDGHVGIYLGNGKFIGSQSSTGVAIADMTNGYWLETFNGRVKRIIAESESEAN